MTSHAPAHRMAAGAVLLFVLLVLPTVAAQTPAIPGDPRGSYFRFMISCPKSYVPIEFQGAADVDCIAQDLTVDDLNVPGQAPQGVVQHFISLTLVPVGSKNETFGWQASSIASLQLVGGETKHFGLHITNLPAITTPVFDIDILANYTAPDGSMYNATTRVTAVLNFYTRGFINMAATDITKKAGQNERVTFTVHVTNDAVFPDNYHASVRSSDPEFAIAQPVGVYVPPHETRDITFTVLTPKDKLYELGRNVEFTTTVTSAQGIGSYTAIASLKVEGAYFPTAWIPMLLVGLVSGMVVVKRTRERAALRRLERGAPRRVAPTPRQAVLLAELKRTDPEAYAERKAALDAIYKTRRVEYRAVSKERRAKDREEMRLARAEFKAARKKQKADEKTARTLAARARKEQKILDAQQAKERKTREKELNKVRKGLEKKRAKLAKKEAKAAKKQAKLDRKQAKVDAKLAAAQAKAAAKEAKAAAKAAKKKGG